jgi:hypothetical protein
MIVYVIQILVRKSTASRHLPATERHPAAIPSLKNGPRRDGEKVLFANILLRNRVA